ncbi:hypothetical protein LTR78_004099 [Recurvomyces mirabilis]|uniref:Uncharacterized protein n=1 Tax=Recurvomyces mirabilis TaxID=574656 RepID=A0AAE0WQB8_9PEZI|nr:hypothetical protein LTR78_004099 [Recurvomyces mirabilis]KAK5153728.1 hypothetical protein LTS14_007422 [Recurvomyces mirabilis]
MANQAPLSYSAAASGASAASTSDHPTDADKVAAQPSKAQEQAVRGESAPTTDRTRQQHQNGPPARRSPSPRHQPRGVAENEAVYILTLQTDKPHHDRMTALRKKYFPPKLNKLEAHLTLFHALPQSRLDSAILPTIQDVVAKNHPFKVTVTKPFRLRHGIALSIPKLEGGSKIQGIHRALQVPWKDQGWLSDQDAGGMQAHYTIMNKVDSDAEVLDAFDEVSREFQGDEGMVEGLGLWRFQPKGNMGIRSQGRVPARHLFSHGELDTILSARFDTQTWSNAVVIVARKPRELSFDHATPTAIEAYRSTQTVKSFCQADRSMHEKHDFQT